MKNPSVFGFELNPLDINLAKMQKQLLGRIKNVTCQRKFQDNYGGIYLRIQSVNMAG